MTFLKIKSKSFKRYGISFYKINGHTFADVNLGLTTWMASLWQRNLLEEAPYGHDASNDLDIHVVSFPYFDEKRSKLKVQQISKITGKCANFPDDDWNI